MKANAFSLIRLLLALSSCHAFAPSTFGRGLSVGQRSLTTKMSAAETSGEVVVKPGMKESVYHYFERVSLQRHAWWNPKRWVLGALTPIRKVIVFAEGVKCNQGSYLYHKKLVFGENFCCAGGVWMGEFEELERALTEPQARTTKLASSAMEPDHLPCNPTGGRLVFLLALANKGAGGDGMWEAVRAAMEDYLTNTEEAKVRSKDATTKGLVDKLVADYKEMGHTEEFLTDPDRGLQDYLLRYLHYVLFGLDPDNKEIMEKINEFHYDSKSAAYYVKVAGKLGKKIKNWPELSEEVGKIYADSPAFSKFPENDPKYNNLTKYELSMSALAILALAGMVGPRTLAYGALAKNTLNDFEGHKTAEIDVLKIWDKLDLNDRDEVTRYLFECGRLRTPVSNSHRVATEDFTVNIRGKDQTFPKGTTIFIPMIFGGIDETFWGPTAFDFDHNRENLCPYSMIFHSVGDRTNGRICPGREIALDMLTDMLIALGEVRRNNLFEKKVETE